MRITTATIQILSQLGILIFIFKIGYAATELEAIKMSGIGIILTILFLASAKSNEN